MQANKQVRKQVTNGDPYQTLIENQNTLPSGVITTQDGERTSRKLRISHEYYVLGKPKAVIARELGLTYHTVRDLIDEIANECNTATLMYAKQGIEQRFEELEMLKAKHHQAWERTQALQDKEEFTEKAVPGEVGPDGKRLMSIVQSTRRKTRHELNVKPLEGIFKCIYLQAKLLGMLDNEKHSAVDDFSDVKSQLHSIDRMTPEQKAEAFADFILRLSNKYRENRPMVMEQPETETDVEAIEVFPDFTVGTNVTASKSIDVRAVSSNAQLPQPKAAGTQEPLNHQCGSNQQSLAPNVPLQQSVAMERSANHIEVSPGVFLPIAQSSNGDQPLQ